MSNDELLRLEALRIALSLQEFVTVGANEPSAKNIVKGKTAEKLVADAAKIYAFMRKRK